METFWVGTAIDWDTFSTIKWQLMIQVSCWVWAQPMTANDIYDVTSSFIGWAHTQNGLND